MTKILKMLKQDRSHLKEPSNEFLLELARALHDAALQGHETVATHLAAGFLWACYPEWFDKEEINNRLVRLDES